LHHASESPATSLIPKRLSDRVQANRRDAITLAKLLRAAELTAVRVRDPTHGVVRDLARASPAAKVIVPPATAHTRMRSQQAPNITRSE